MRKISHFSVRDQENSGKIHYSPVKKFHLEVMNDTMSLSSHGGLLLLWQEEHGEINGIFSRQMANNPFFVGYVMKKNYFCIIKLPSKVTLLKNLITYKNESKEGFT